MSAVQKDSNSVPSTQLTLCLSYLCKAALLNETTQPGVPEGNASPLRTPAQILQSQYKEVTPALVTKTAAALYLDPSAHPIAQYEVPQLIFPFGINESQFEAVRQAMANQMSMIQGPPGTGKTQTILNIIANFLLQGKTMLVVSGTNSATANIQEKLASPNVGLDFLTAFLGNSQNKESFIQHQSEQYPDISSWQRTKEQKAQIAFSINTLTNTIAQTFAAQKRLAQSKEERRALQLERTYFEKFLSETISPLPLRLRARTRPNALLHLWLQCERCLENNFSLSFWQKCKYLLFHGIGNWSFYRHPLPEIIFSLKQAYYPARLHELDQKIASLETALSDIDLPQLTSQLIEQSMTYLHAQIYDLFHPRLQKKRPLFDKSQFRNQGANVCREYPIILSTTYSARTSLPGHLYDCLIMDEASQVDISSGVMALTTAQRAVIVGDAKQLPNVLSARAVRAHKQLFRCYSLPESYFAGRESFLTSLRLSIPQLPQTLLREHYRCHPSIIRFCNQKFYNDELLIMTEDHGEADVLRLVQTVPGHHEKQHMNQRQIDVLREEVLPSLSQVPTEDIGLIAPYRNQVQQIQKQLTDCHINAANVSTVHKFQGREKGTIILSTTDDIITSFSDDPHLLNVAVSRAKRRLILITSAEEQPGGSNIGDLIAYIRYQGGTWQTSQIRSIFDLLYRSYAAERRQFLASHTKISQFASENLMYGLIENMLQQFPHLPLRAVPHVPLREIFSPYQLSILSAAEQKYIRHGAHTDFLFYHALRKTPLFAVEVDGFHFHQEGTKQHERDRMKDHIFKTLHIPLLRFSASAAIPNASPPPLQPGRVKRATPWRRSP